MPSVPASGIAPATREQHRDGWVLGVAWAVFTALALLLIPALDQFAIDARFYGLLVPLGSFFNRLQATDMAALPWASILGFADVIAAIAAVVWFAHRRERRAAAKSA